MRSSKFILHNKEKIAKIVDKREVLQTHSVDYYLNVYLKHKSLNSNPRFFYNCLNKVKNLSNKSFENYYLSLIQYKKVKGYKTGDGLYNPNYIAVLYNVNLDEAKSIIAQKKQSKCTSLNAFIARHGEEKGTALFKKFVETSNWRKEFLLREGEEALRIKNQTVSKRNTKYWTSLGYSEEEAKELVSTHQKENSGVHREYYIKKGYTEEETNQILEAINFRKDSRNKTKCVYIETYGYPTYIAVYSAYCNLRNDCNSVGYFKRRYGKDWRIHYDENRLRIKAKHRCFVPIDKLDSWEFYKKECWYLTNEQIRLNGDKIKDLNKRGKEFHLDHIFSIFDGFKQNIDPAIISHWSNLRIITRTENISKNYKSNKSYEDLICDYKRCNQEDN